MYVPDFMWLIISFNERASTHNLSRGCGREDGRNIIPMVVFQYCHYIFADTAAMLRVSDNTLHFGKETMR